MITNTIGPVVYVFISICTVLLIVYKMNSDECDPMLIAYVASSSTIVAIFIFIIIILFNVLMLKI